MAAPNRPPTPNPNPNPNSNPNPNTSNHFSASLHRPVFTGRPLSHTPLIRNPNPKGILYPVSSRPLMIPPNATVYTRPPGHAPQHQHQLVYSGPDAHLTVRPPVLPSFGVPRPAGPTAQPPLGPTLKGVPIPSHAKVHSLPTVAPTLEYSLAKERERNREERDSFIVINDRKVRVTDGESSSLYSLCRSWVRNGMINHETQSNNGNNERPLPRPLPAFNDTLINNELKDEDDLSEKENESVPVEQLTIRDLLKGHIKRALRVRARLRKERSIKIRRYKQRLALLLPSSEFLN